MMKKFVLGISLMMALMAAPAVALAGTQQQCEKNGKECVEKKNCKEGKECVEKSSCPQGKECKKAKKECVKDGKKCSKDGLQKFDKKDKKGKKDGDRCFGRHDGKGHGKMNKADRRARLFEGIALNEAQQQKLAALDNKVKVERKEAKAKMDAERDKMKAKADKDRAKFRAEYDKALSDILTPEQYAKYQENQKAIQSKRMEKRAAKEAQKDGKMKAGKKGPKHDKSGKRVEMNKTASANA